MRYMKELIIVKCICEIKENNTYSKFIYPIKFRGLLQGECKFKTEKVSKQSLSFEKSR